MASCGTLEMSGQGARLSNRTKYSSQKAAMNMLELCAGLSFIRLHVSVDEHRVRLAFAARLLSIPST